MEFSIYLVKLSAKQRKLTQEMVVPLWIKLDSIEKSDIFIVFNFS